MPYGSLLDDSAQQIYLNTRCLNQEKGDKPGAGVQRFTHELHAELSGRLQSLAPRRAYSGLAGHLWEQFTLPRRMRHNDKLLSPANTGPLSVRNQVLVLHDLAAWDHPEWFTPLFAGWYHFLWPRLVQRVQHVVTVSLFSKQRICAALKLSPEKVTTVPEAANLSFYPATPRMIESVRERYKLRKPYFLFVGTLEPRKNLARLLQAWQEASLQEVELLVAGSAGSSRIFRRLGLPGSSQTSTDLRSSQPGPPANVRWLGYVPDNDLPVLLSAALALVYPSLYEGFGLPLLEAMACGTPVIAANTTALPETAGGAALLVDPYAVDSITSALLAIRHEAHLRLDLRAAGLQHAAAFSWQQTAQRILEILGESGL
jgi:glycosyltransferase involved in cell wall biosynthesis